VAEAVEHRALDFEQQLADLDLTVESRSDPGLADLSRATLF